MARPNIAREDNIRWVEAVEMFHTLYIPTGPYRSVVPRLVGEIVERLDPADKDRFRSALLSMFGKRGANVRSAKQKQVSVGGVQGQFPFQETQS
jgi:hypothetical protein